ncbi:MAG: MarR family transcriptional regulator [Pseudomonadota bacterium]
MLDTPGRSHINSNQPIDLLDELLADWARERPDLNAGAMGVVGRIVYLGALLEQQANTALKPLSLRYTDFDVLATLRRSGTPYKRTPTALRRSVLITSGAMTACLDRLEQAELIAREPDPTDRRGTIVKLTRKGQRTVDDAVAVRFQVAHEALGGLNEQEARRLADLLRKLSLTLAI